ncbi:MAG: peroxiredoxin family protein, partial [Isosphaeraceae bacterium]
ERVIPLPHPWISRRTRLWSLGEPVRIVAGETTRITIGGNGRPVIGRVLAPEGSKGSINFAVGSVVRIESNRPYFPYPLELVRGKVNLRDAATYEWSRKWDKSPEGIAQHESRVAGEIELAPDGSFRFDALPAGDYRVSIRINENGSRQPQAHGPFDRVVKEFTVPAFSGPRQPEPLDLGEFRLTVWKSREGEPAPDFPIKTVDGKTVRLADYRGKFLLLDFVAMWDEGCVLGIPSLNEIHERFGKDGRLAMLSLVMAENNEKSRAFVAAKGEPWPQAIIGPMSNPITIAYGIDDELPASVLIGPDGKIYPRKFELTWTIKSIARVLGQWRPPSPDEFLPRAPVTPGSP